MEIGKELAKELLTTLQSTKQFVLDQAPDVLQQVIKYYFWESLAVMIISFLAVLFIFLVNVWYWRKWDTICEKDLEPSCIVVISASLFIAAPSILLFLENLFKFK